MQPPSIVTRTYDSIFCIFQKLEQYESECDVFIWLYKRHTILWFCGLWHHHHNDRGANGVAMHTATELTVNLFWVPYDAAVCFRSAPSATRLWVWVSWQWWRPSSGTVRCGTPPALCVAHARSSWWTSPTAFMTICCTARDTTPSNWSRAVQRVTR
jgi:hypothetical protein